MGTRGINLISYTETSGKSHILRLRPKIGQPSFPTWVDNIRVDVDSGGYRSTFWELAKDQKKLTDTINSLSRQKELLLCLINLFNFNGKSISVTDLFPSKRQYCCFRVEKNRWSLMIVGTKTAEEMITIGNDVDGDSISPLLLVPTKEKEFRLLNPL